MKKPLKAFILAAGFGTRLRPLTNLCPKPLLPFFGVPLLYIILEQLNKLSVDEIFVNGHYLAEQIQLSIQQYPLPIKVSFCDERSEILGTAGAIGAIRNKLSGSDLIVINGDIVTNFDITSLVNKHQESTNIASMGLLTRVYPQKTVLWCDDNHILGIGGPSPHERDVLHKYGFSCIQVLSEGFYKHIPSSSPSEIIPIYKDFIKKGIPISFLALNPFWSDIGSPRDYFDAHAKAILHLENKSFLKSLCLNQCWKRLGMNPFFSRQNSNVNKEKGLNSPFFFTNKPTFEENSNLGPNAFIFLESTKIPSNMQIKNSLVLPGVQLTRDETIYNSILGKNFQTDWSTDSV